MVMYKPQPPPPPPSFSVILTVQISTLTRVFPNHSFKINVGPMHYIYYINKLITTKVD